MVLLTLSNFVYQLLGMLIGIIIGCLLNIWFNTMDKKKNGKK